MRTACFLVALTTILAISRATAAADVVRLTLDEAVQRAATANLDLQASSKDLDVANAAVDRSTAWVPSNPYFSFGASARAETNGRPNVFAFLSQEVEIAGQRRFRLDSARHGLEREAANQEQAAMALAITVKLAFIHAVLSAERLRLAQQHADLAGELLQRTEADDPSTTSGRIDLNAARIQHLRTRRDAAALEQSREDALDVLRRLLDLSFDDDIEPVGTAPTTALPAPPLPELIERARHQRADLKAFERAAQSSDAQLQVARREQIPNVTLSASYSRFEDSGDFAGGDIGMPLPLFRSRDADVIEAAAERDRAALQFREMQREVEREVREARRTYVNAATDLDTYRNSIMPLAEETVQLQRRLLERDESNDADYINQQMEMLGTRRDYVDVVEKFNVALFELERAIGGRLDQPAAAPAP